MGRDGIVSCLEGCCLGKGPPNTYSIWSHKGLGQGAGEGAIKHADAQGPPKLLKPASLGMRLGHHCFYYYFSSPVDSVAQPVLATNGESEARIL